MTLPRDLRLAVRSLRRRPGYAAIALATIAIGIAASTTIFSILQGVLLRPLPYRNPEQLVVFRQQDPETGFYISASIPNYRDWTRASTGLADFGAAAGWSWALTGTGGPAEMVNGRIVLGDFFRTLGATPVLGHLLAAGATEPGAQPVAVVSYAFWQRHFGGDTAAVGRTIILSQQPYTVVGVLPRGWGWPNAHQDIYIPMGALSYLPMNNREAGFGTDIVARLKPGVTLAAANREVERVGKEVAAQATTGIALPELEGAAHYLLGDIRMPLYAVSAAVIFVLLIAVSNVANLQLARGEERRREMAVRMALGAGSGRLLRQVLVESLLISTVGGLLGLALSWIGVRVLVGFLPSDIPDTLVHRIGIDPMVLLFAVAVTLGAGVLLGIVPALRAARTEPVNEIRSDTRSTPRGRLRAGLVAAEIALAMVLLVGAGLTVRSLTALGAVDKGFDADHVLTASVSLPPGYDSPDRYVAFYSQLLDRLRAAPGIRHAAVALEVPLNGRSWENGSVPEGTPLSQSGANSMLFNVVSEDYFQTMGVPLLAGRGFTTADRSGSAPVAIVDERMAQRFWPGESAIGKRVNFAENLPDSTGDNPTPLYRTVVGVVKNVRHYELQEPSRIEGYIPFRQTQGRGSSRLSVALKTSGDPLTAAPTVRRLVTELDSDTPVSDIRTMQSWVDDAVASNRIVERLFTLFSAIAVTLAAIGIFGVMSYTVAQRRRELSIRVALGAGDRNILSTVLGRSAAVALLGIGIGALLAFPLAGLVRGLLYGVAPFDPLTYAGLSLVLLAVAALAAYLPARRALRIDPATVLKEE